MIEIVKVSNCRQRKDFLRFPEKLYKGNSCYTPPLYMDERKIFRKDFVYNDTCDAVYFNAYRDGRMVGRISGIIQKAANEKNGEKRVRFCRFEALEDFEAAKLLFEAVENWAREKGMDTACGPLSFSDLEREGLLVGGFEYPATFEETWNPPYYGEFIEKLGYKKEVDWTGSRLRIAKDYDGELEQMADYVMRRYKLHLATARTTKEYLAKYADGFFELLDKSYDLIYGSVPFTDAMKKLMLDNFSLILSKDNLVIVLDENDKMICMGLAFPAVGDALRPSGGRLTPGALIRVLRAIKHPKVLDLGLVGVDPEWLNRGISVVISAAMVRMLRMPGVLYAETNMNLEDNYAIQNQWKRFDEQKIKLHRCYVKNLA